jgi:cyclopropane fatty-acyl-phospholipid synthase-like methyltransferase
MEIHDLVTVSQGSLAIMNPTTAEKLLAAGRAADLCESSRVVDFGCGNGTTLLLWGEAYRITGVGIDEREEACEQATRVLQDAGLSDRIEIRCTDATEYRPDQPFDCAACIGSSHIWGGFAPAVHALQEMVHEDGVIVIGDRSWRSDRTPPEFAREWPEVPTEYEILRTVRESGFDLAAVIRASDEDWDRYESGIWQSLLGWLADHPVHPDRDDVVEYLRRLQDEYTGYGREYMGWALYVLVPAVM